MKPAALVLVLALPLGAGDARAAEGTGPGDLAAVALPVGAAVGTLVARDHRGLAQLAESYAAAMALVYVLKPLVDRTRPYGGGRSFPSGHAASAFAGAAFLQMRYGWELGLPAYAVATYVGYSRVQAERHHTSDVVAGAAIGIAANLVFTRRREHVAVQVDLGPRHAGTSIAVAW
jgi:membrane-associated phospholipid phosphatase